MAKSRDARPLLKLRRSIAADVLWGAPATRFHRSAVIPHLCSRQDQSQQAPRRCADRPEQVDAVILLADDLSFLQLPHVSVKRRRGNAAHGFESLGCIHAARDRSDDEQPAFMGKSSARADDFPEIVGIQAEVTLKKGDKFRRMCDERIRFDGVADPATCAVGANQAPRLQETQMMRRCDRTNARLRGHS